MTYSARSFITDLRFDGEDSAITLDAISATFPTANTITENHFVDPSIPAGRVRVKVLDCGPDLIAEILERIPGCHMID